MYGKLLRGGLVAGADFSGSDPADDPRGAAAALYQKVQDMVIGAEQVEMDFHTLGFRPTPGDGFPMMAALRVARGFTLR